MTAYLYVYEQIDKNETEHHFAPKTISMRTRSSGPYATDPQRHPGHGTAAAPVAATSGLFAIVQEPLQPTIGHACCVIFFEDVRT